MYELLQNLCCTNPARLPSEEFSAMRAPSETTEAFPPTDHLISFVYLYVSCNIPGLIVLRSTGISVPDIYPIGGNASADRPGGVNA